MVNQLKALGLLAVLSSMLITLGALMGPMGLAVAIVLAVAMNALSYFHSDRIVLRMHQAQQMSRDDYPGLIAIAEELSVKAGIPTPKLYIIPANYPNAFATGRNPKHGVVAITEGLIQLLSVRELRGVIAHEIAHIRNRDILLATVAAMITSAITYIASFFQLSAIFGSSEESDDQAHSPVFAMLVSLAAPFGACLVQLAISRSRKYSADAYAAKISGDPFALANALRKLSGASADVFEEPSSPGAASLFIVNPLHGRAANWFSTHPPTQERISRLTQLAARASDQSERQAQQERMSRRRAQGRSSLQLD